VADALGISAELLYRWRTAENKNGKLAFPGHGTEALTPEQKLIRELEKALRDARIERDILKKAVGIFSTQPK
jgi:transposase-like protein